MSESDQILYMQSRLSRKATEKWNKSLPEVIAIFTQYKVFEYIEECYGIFHVQGDDANLEDVESYLSNKGASLC